MLFSAHQPCLDMDRGPGGSIEYFSNSKSSKRLTLRSLPVCPAIVGWWWENYLYLAPLSGGCRCASIFTPLALFLADGSRPRVIQSLAPAAAPPAHVGTGQGAKWTQQQTSTSQPAASPLGSGWAMGHPPGPAP